MNDTLVGLSIPCYDQREEWRRGREDVLKTLRTEGKRGRWRTRTEREGGRREEVEGVKKRGGRERWTARREEVGGDEERCKVSGQ